MILRLLAAGAVLAAPPAAQAWAFVRMGQGPGPNLRQVLMMAADPANRQVVTLVGDRQNGVWTWLWDGVQWHSHATQQLPWYPMALVHDPVRRRMVLLSTDEPNQDRVEIHEWDGSTWTHATPTVRPSSRHSAAFAFDPVQRRMILFGGYDQIGNRYLGDTWEWNGGQWTQLTPVSTPGARAVHQRGVTDPLRSRIVLYGATGAPILPLSDTWEWDGVTWQPRFVNQAGLGQTWLVYDPARQRVIKRGNATLWEFDGTTWSPVQQPPGPQPGNGPLAFDPMRREVVLVETGAPDFWRLTSGTVPGAVTTLGTGCGGLLLQTGGLAAPMLGQPLTVIATGIPPGGGPVLLAFGGTDPRWQGFPLPFDLGWAGLPGCRLHSDLAGGSVPMPAGAWASVTLAVPGGLALLGWEFTLQAVAQAPAANAGGWIVSNGLRLRIGG